MKNRTSEILRQRGKKSVLNKQAKPTMNHFEIHKPVWIKVTSQKSLHRFRSQIQMLLFLSFFLLQGRQTQAEFKEDPHPPLHRLSFPKHLSNTSVHKKAWFGHHGLPQVKSKTSGATKRRWISWQNSSNLGLDAGQFNGTDSEGYATDVTFPSFHTQNKKSGQLSI